ncbi:MAG: hypothetical protein DWQ42_08570 [Planctomycetota bacterium]|nr:MAG: hypothetical protein DWQ42_08570 [Planctomycetota bacterium]REK38419.1 MAG: hypothetical protein DWQ46_20530 [Planctomycetota bacterium]
MTAPPSSRHRSCSSRLLRLLRKPLLAAVATLLALGAMELAVRLVRPAPALAIIDVRDPRSPYVRSPNPIMRFELKPNFRAEYAVGLATTNAYGLRDVPREIEAAQGVRRIVLLGDSVVEGINYVGDDETISRQLEQMFPDGTEVFNVGVSGYCTLAEIELLKLKALQFSPDVVVVVFARNDFMNFHPEFAREGSILERPAVVKWFYRHSHIYRIACLQFNWYQFRDEADPSQWNAAAIGEENNVLTGLRELERLAEEHRFEPLIAVWPAFLDKEIVDPHMMNDGSGDLVIERLAWSRGIATVRLSDHYRNDLKALPESPSPRVAYTARSDTMHPNARGCELAAEALYHALTTPEARSLKPLSADDFDPQAVQMANLIAQREASLQVESDDPQLQVLERQFRLAEMESHLRAQLEETPDNYRARIKLGLQYARQRRLEEALAQFARATECQPAPDDLESWQYISAFFYAAAIHKQLGNQRQSTRFYERGCKYLPSNTTGPEAAAFAARDLNRGLLPNEPPPEVIDTRKN